MLESCVLLGSLAAFAWFDIKQKKFPLPLLIGCGAAGLAFFFVTGQPSPSSLLGGVCVGGALSLCSVITHGNVGMGDGVLLCITGLYLGMWMNLALLFAGVVFCAVAGLILMIAKKCTRKQSLPLAPFLLASDVVMLALTM